MRQEGLLAFTCLFSQAKDGTVSGTKELVWRESNEQPDTLLPNGAIEWIKDEEKEGPWKAMFKLGDFKSFGGFLKDIAGKSL